MPQETVSDKRVLTMGGTEIQILFLGRAHTVRRPPGLSAVLAEELVNFRRALENLVSESRRLHAAKVPLEKANFRRARLYAAPGGP